MYEDFVTWYVARRKRTTGIPAAQHTIRNKLTHLRGATSVLHLQSSGELAVALSNRATVDKLLDAWYARLAPGTVAIAVQALMDYGAYAVAKGAIDECALARGDLPTLRESTPKNVYDPTEVERWWGPHGA